MARAAHRERVRDAAILKLVVVGESFEKQRRVTERWTARVGRDGTRTVLLERGANPLRDFIYFNYSIIV